MTPRAAIFDLDGTLLDSGGMPFVGVLSGGTPEKVFRRAGLDEERIVPSVAHVPELFSKIMK